MKSTSSALISIPVDEDKPLRSCIGNELVIASPANLSPPFRLPHGWTVRKRRRRSSYEPRFDKYYYEPETGRQFRSLRSIQKHLCETDQGLITSGTWTPGSEGHRLSLRCSREMQIVTCPPSRFNLPDGWIVEEKPRSSYPGHIDRYYKEPGTGQRFRSLIAVQRYLSALDEYSTPLTASTSNQFSASNSSDSSQDDYPDDDCSLQVIRNLIKAKKKLTSSQPLKPTSPTEKNAAVEKDRGSVLDSMSPPAKINWVLTGSGGNMFSPFMGDSMVPESVKQKWSEAFTLAVRD